MMVIILMISSYLACQMPNGHHDLQLHTNDPGSAVLTNNF